MKDGYAAEVSDDMPAGLEFLPDNETNKGYRWVMYDKEGNVISTKENNGNHGYGLKSVYIAVQKYKGLYCATGEDGEYKVEIYLPITVDGEIWPFMGMCVE